MTLIPGIPDTHYHAHRALGSSIVRHFDEVAPAQWLYERQNPTDSTADHYEEGKAVHTLALGVGSPVVLVDAADWRGKAAKEKRAEIRGNGGIALLPEAYYRVHEMAASLHAHPLGVALRDGQSEMTGYSVDRESGLECKVRPDCMYRPRVGGLTLVIDVKTTTSVDPRKIAESCWKFGYFRQAPFYKDRLLEHDIEVAFAFLFVSKEPPYLATAIELLPEAEEFGRRRNCETLAAIARCTQTGLWPAYGPEIHQVDLPSWAYKQEEYR